MLTSDFDFDLPAHLVAQEPATPRESARLLVAAGDGVPSREHVRVSDLPRFLRAGDLLVVNDTRVLPARFLGRRATGGAVEVLFLEPAPSVEPGAGRGAGEDDSPPWRAMVRPAKKIRPGERVHSDTGVDAVFVEREEVGGTWTVRLEPARESASARDQAPSNAEASDFLALLDRAGTTPLPPYIDRAATGLDAERYQTVYSRVPGAVAAPTAGLHFSKTLLDELERLGVRRTAVTLHVGAGTFLPVSVESIDQHSMHSESYELTEAAAEAVRECRDLGGRVVAVGTTSARVLESCAVPFGDGSRHVVEPRRGRTDIFLRPGFGPRVCDGLFTNFHLPKSTLLMLVASMIGRDAMLSLYREAVELEYRFYSYGDAMLLLPH